jgi:hypothetical protein
MKISGLCPWCESNQELSIGREYLEGPPYFVFCSGCDCRGPQADTKPNARYFWNQRTVAK